MKTNSHSGLPDGWKIENLTSELVRISLPHGHQFFSRIKAIEFMIETNMDYEYIYNLWLGLESEGWIFGQPFVPQH